MPDASPEIPRLPPLPASFGPIEWVRQVDTKRKSIVLIIGSDGAVVVAKRASADLLRRERRFYESVLPSYEIAAPSFRGWMDDGDAAWLITDHIEGRTLDLSLLGDREAVSRWAARLHVRTMTGSARLPRPTPRPSAEERLQQIEDAAAGQSAASADRRRAVQVCAELRALLPSVVAAAEQLHPALAHLDLAPQNLLVTRDGILAVDWDRAGYGCPAPDLWIVQPEVYCDEMSRLGADPDVSLVSEAARAGSVMADLNHDIAAKRPDVQRRYLARMLQAASGLHGAATRTRASFRELAAS